MRKFIVSACLTVLLVALVIAPAMAGTANQNKIDGGYNYPAGTNLGESKFNQWAGADKQQPAPEKRERGLTAADYGEAWKIGSALWGVDAVAQDGTTFKGGGGGGRVYAR